MCFCRIFTTTATYHPYNNASKAFPKPIIYWIFVPQDNCIATIDTKLLLTGAITSNFGESIKLATDG